MLILYFLILDEIFLRSVTKQFIYTVFYFLNFNFKVLCILAHILETELNVSIPGCPP